MEALNEIEALYQQLLAAWNNQSARGMAELFSEEGELIRMRFSPTSIPSSKITLPLDL